MSLDFNNIIDDNILEFNVYKEGLNPKQVSFNPLYINPRGNIFYGGNNHKNSDIHKIVIEYIENFYRSNQVSLSIYDKNTSYTRIKKYHDEEKLDFNAVDYYLRNTFYNNKNEISLDNMLDYALGYYSVDTMEYINLIIESNNIIKRKIEEVEYQCSDKIKAIKSLLVIKNCFSNNLLNNSKFNSFVDEEYNAYNWFLAYQNITSDFLVQFLDFDKIETNYYQNKTISTSKNNHYKYFFNYLLMDYEINKLPKIIFNSKKGIFEETSYLDTYKDDEYQKELSLIKKYTKKNERDKYFIK